jgi:hypothetical protein
MPTQILGHSRQSRDTPLRGKRFIEVRERLMALFFGDGKTT